MAKPAVAFCAIFLAIGTSQVFSASIGTTINADEAVTLILSDKNQNVVTSAQIGGVLGRLASKMNIKRIEFGTPDIVAESDAEDNTGTEFKITEGENGITMKIDGDSGESDVEVTLHKDEENKAEATINVVTEATATDEESKAEATINVVTEATATDTGDEGNSGDNDEDPAMVGVNVGGAGAEVTIDTGDEGNSGATTDTGDEGNSGATTDTGDEGNSGDDDEESINTAAENLSVENVEEDSNGNDESDSSDSDSSSDSDESKNTDKIKGSNTLDVLSESEEEDYNNLYSQDSSSQEDSDEISPEWSGESSEESLEWLPPRRPLLPVQPLPSRWPLPPRRPQEPLPWWLKGLRSQKTVHHIVHHVGSPVVLGGNPYGIGLPAHHLLGANRYQTGAKVLPPSRYGAPLSPSMALPLQYLDQTWGPQSQLALHKLLAKPCKQVSLEKAALAARKEALLAKVQIMKDIAEEINLRKSLE